MREKITAGKIWGIVYPVLLYTGITIIIGNLIAMVLMVMVMVTGDASSRETIENTVYSALNSQVMMMTLCSALATLPFLVFFMHRDIQREKLNNRFIKYERVSFFKYLLIIPFGIFGMLSANYFVSILTLIMPKFMTESYTDTAQYIYGSQLVVQVIAAGIICPIVEELIFRGLVYKRLKKISSVMVAGIISSLLFGIYHGNWVQAPYAFIVGMLCVYVYEKYKSIVAPILFHMSANMLSVLVTALVGQTAAEQSGASVPLMQQLMACTFMTVVTGVLAFAMALIIKKTVNPKEIKV